LQPAKAQDKECRRTDFKQVLNFLVVICLFNYSTSSLLESRDSSIDSNSNREAKSELDDRTAQKKRRIDNAQALTMSNVFSSIWNTAVLRPYCCMYCSITSVGCTY
jgi:hypothetical protein